MKIRILCAVCILLCAVSPSFALFKKKAPKPEKSEYLVTAGGGFLRAGETRGIVYAMTFKRLKMQDRTMYALITFENPSDKDRPLTAEMELTAGQEQIIAQSPVIKSIKNKKNYLVTVTLYADRERSEKLGEHKQELLFYLPPKIAKQIGLKLL